MDETTQSSSETASEAAVQESSTDTSTGQVDSGESSSEAKLESKVSDMLAKVNGEEPSATDTGAEKADDEAAAEPAAKQEKSEPKPVSKTPTLPDAYVRSLKALEWTEEEIEAAAANPKFLETAAKLHQTRNRELQEWASLGRAKQTQERAPNQQQRQQAPNGLAPIDVQSLKKEYGDEKLIDALAGPINTAIAQINEHRQFIEQTRQVSERSHLETLGRQVETFFGGLKDYSGFYGKDGATNPEQMQARNKVLEQANDLIVGAQLRGQNISIEQALSFAHEAASAGYAKTAARKEIASSLQQRSRSITLKPQGKRPESNKPLSEKEKVSKVQSQLNSIFKNR